MYVCMHSNTKLSMYVCMYVYATLASESKDGQETKETQGKARQGVGIDRRGKPNRREAHPQVDQEARL